MHHTNGHWGRHWTTSSIDSGGGGGWVSSLWFQPFIVGAICATRIKYFVDWKCLAQLEYRIGSFLLLPDYSFFYPPCSPLPNSSLVSSYNQGCFIRSACMVSGCRDLVFGIAWMPAVIIIPDKGWNSPCGLDLNSTLIQMTVAQNWSTTG